MHLHWTQLDSLTRKLVLLPAHWPRLLHSRQLLSEHQYAWIRQVKASPKTPRATSLYHQFCVIRKYANHPSVLRIPPLTQVRSLSGHYQICPNENVLELVAESS